MAIKNRIIFWAILATLLVLALAYAFWPRPIPADLATVTRGALSVSIDEEGETRVKDMFVVSAPASGTLDRITLEPGDHVLSGQTLLASIKPSTSPILDSRTEAQLNAAVRSARAAVSVAEADLERLISAYKFAKSEGDRAKPLYEQDLISRAAYERTISAVDTANAAVHSAEAALRMRRSELQMARSALLPSVSNASDCECVEVRSVIDGVILKVVRESEGPVVQGAPLLEIGDPAETEIVVDLLSEDAVAVSVGDPVIISGWGGDPLEGIVRIIEPYAFTKISALGIEEQRVNVIIDLDNSDEDAKRLGHGYRVDIAIVVWQGEDVLSLPMTTLFKQGTDWSAYKLQNGRAELNTLELGRMNGRRAQILSGLKEGDKVIEHPSNRIADGIRVVDRRQ
ncbi:MAG: HlyD family efflux transporter periplasmic adaptor subunit [Acidimicrobiales bacterium]|nr:HlyD family efflux transporter periplasmic adaptor subunit [Hyphomonadaceae bacterium]RZV43263.1 MAG: HlyD family efflux transporter periplasmic adaptor subunit [Acidimicrobiales bacterium]